jgi:ABC-type polysaccharide/polyol phosphate transport system ATPase subunit
VDFAELWEFIDVPVKNFSSGMIARLGFAIATEVKADVLIVDEILAVGDHRFREKCHQRMANMLGNGTTLLLVSHNDQQVRELCSRAIWLKHGHVVVDGPVDEVCDAYANE